MQNKKKILFIIPKAESFRTFFTGMGEELLHQGYEVYLLTNNQNNISLGKINIRHLIFPRGINLFHHFRCRSRINSMIREISPDIVHVHFSACIFTVAMSKKRDRPFTIGTFHGVSFPLVKKRFMKTILRIAEIWSAKKLDMTCVLTNDDHTALAKKIKKGNIYCYRSAGVGCNIDKFDRNKYTGNDIRELRAELNLNSDDFVMIYIGRFVDFKGYGLVLRSFEMLEPHCDNRLKLLLLGRRDGLHPTGINAELERKILNSSNVRMIGWTDRVDRYLSVADVNVFPSVREGMPVNVMESLSMGVPAIVANARGSRDLIDRDNGRILKHLSAECISDTISELFANKPELERLKKNAVSQRDKFGQEVYIREQISIYESIMQRDNVR